jgi:zinc/manganese transport system substrate-binding protein
LEITMPITRRTFAATTIAGALGVSRASAKGSLRVVTSTEDLAALAREVGGDRVTAESIARGYQDPHFVEPKPSFIIKLNRADLLISVGLQLEIGWLPPLITQSRNSKIQPGSPGYLDASTGVEILQKPVGQVSRAMGDIHPLGNPHYWLDPENGRHMARSIQAKLTQLSPDDGAYFQQRFEDFGARLTTAQKAWEANTAPYKGKSVVTYHQSWPNFAKRFGLEVQGYVEPRPGIPPSPSHTFELINQMKKLGIKQIWYEPYFDSKTPKAIANAVGGEAIVLLPSVGGLDEVKDYIQLFDYDTKLVAASFARLGPEAK